MERLRRVDELGFSPSVWSAFDESLRHKSGVILLLGMRGSGLTTTNCAALRELAKRRVGKIVSIEDPVEWLLAGVEQIAVSATRGFVQSVAIDEAVRRDPAVISTGVVVDSESLRKVFEHAADRLVLATMWGDSIDGLLPRLLDLGADVDDLRRHLRAILRQEIVDGVCVAEHVVPCW